MGEELNEERKADRRDGWKDEIYRWKEEMDGRLTWERRPQNR